MSILANPLRLIFFFYLFYLYYSYVRPVPADSTVREVANLITDYGIIGAAYATLIVLVIMNSLKIYLIKIKFKMHPYSNDTIKIIVLSLSLIHI